jgi:hypothetical protein
MSAFHYTLIKGVKKVEYGSSVNAIKRLPIYQYSTCSTIDRTGLKRMQSNDYKLIKDEMI